MKLLVTGGCGFLGSNLAAHGIERGDEVLVLDNLSRQGSADNLKWLESTGKFEFRQMDVRDAEGLVAELRQFCPEVVFHLAGQVAMTTSMSNPRSCTSRLMHWVNIPTRWRQYAKRLQRPQCSIRPPIRSTEICCNIITMIRLRATSAGSILKGSTKVFPWTSAPHMVAPRGLPTSTFWIMAGCSGSRPSSFATRRCTGEDSSPLTTKVGSAGAPRAGLAAVERRPGVIHNLWRRETGSRRSACGGHGLTLLRCRRQDR